MGAKFSYDTDTRSVKSGTSESFKLVRWAIPYVLFQEKHCRAGNVQEMYFAKESSSLLVLFLVATVLQNYELGTAVLGKCVTWYHVRSSFDKSKGLYIGEKC